MTPREKLSEQKYCHKVIIRSFKVLRLGLNDCFVRQNVRLNKDLHVIHLLSVY